MPTVARDGEQRSPVQENSSFKRAQEDAKAAGDGPPPSADTVEYWDVIYKERPASWDTLYSYDDIRFIVSGIVDKSLRSKAKVLHAGCGTSELTRGLWRDGFRHICNFDFSEVLVNLMQGRWQDLARGAATKEEEQSMLAGSVQWLCMDIMDLSALPGGEFHLAIEKFTLDALLCEAKDDASSEKGRAAIRELHRVLRPGAPLLSIAWGEGPRMELLKAGGLFDVEARRLPGDALQRPLIYLCRKRQCDTPPVPRTATVQPGRAADLGLASSPSVMPAAAQLTQAAVMQDPEVTAAATDPTTSIMPKVEAEGSASVTVLPDGLVDISIRFEGDPKTLPQRASHIEVDLSESAVRWRRIGGQVWQEVQLSTHVDVAAAQAKFRRRVNTGGVAPVSPNSAELRIVAPQFKFGVRHDKCAEQRCQD